MGDRVRGLLLDGSHVRLLVVSVAVSQVDVAGAGGGGHAGLDEDAVAGRGGGDLAVAQVAHGALAQRQHAAEADAHPAAGRHQDAGVLAGVEKRGGAVGLDGRAGLGEGDRAALAGRRRTRRAEALGVQPVGAARRRPVLLERVEHAGRPAGPGLALGQVGHEVVERRRRRACRRCRCAARSSRIRPSAASARSSSPKMTSSRGGRGVHQDDVGRASARGCAACP